MDNIAVFSPRAGMTQWWTGDPNSLAPLKANEPHRHIVVQRHALTPEQCRILIDCFERNRESCATRNAAAFWAGRFIWQDALGIGEVDAIRIMQQARFLAHVLLDRIARPPRPVYSDTAQLVRWHEGLELTPHADNVEPDGRPNATPHRCFSSLIYLNDSYEGGETYFPGYGVRLKPETGALVLFGAGPHYVHGVTRIRRGLRYTYAGWFTFDKDREDANAMRVF
jgi:hypothetical protein